jgi:hypothetical protein
MLASMAADPDLALRQAAITRAQDLSEAYDGLVPLAAPPQCQSFNETWQ